MLIAKKNRQNEKFTQVCKIPNQGFEDPFNRAMRNMTAEIKKLRSLPMKT